MKTSTKTQSKWAALLPHEDTSHAGILMAACRRCLNAFKEQFWFSVLPKEILACAKKELGIEPST